MPNRDEVAQIIRATVIETFSLKEPIIDDNISFKDDLRADSIDMVSLAWLLEEKFSGEIDEDQVERFKTITDVIDYVIERLNQENIEEDASDRSVNG